MVLEPSDEVFAALIALQGDKRMQTVVEWMKESRETTKDQLLWFEYPTEAARDKERGQGQMLDMVYGFLLDPGEAKKRIEEARRKKKEQIEKNKRAAQIAKDAM